MELMDYLLLFGGLIYFLDFKLYVNLWKNG